MYCDVGNLQICVYTGVRKVTPPYARCCTLHTQAQAHGTLSHSPTHYSDNRGGLSKRGRGGNWELRTGNCEPEFRLSTLSLDQKKRRPTLKLPTIQQQNTFSSRVPRFHDTTTNCACSFEFISHHFPSSSPSCLPPPLDRSSKPSTRRCFFPLSPLIHSSAGLPLVSERSVPASGCHRLSTTTLPSPVTLARPDRTTQKKVRRCRFSTTVTGPVRDRSPHGIRPQTTRP